MKDKNIFGYDPKKAAREEGEKERKEWLDRQLRPPQKWGEDTSNIRETKSKFDNMPSDEYLGRKIISVKEEGHKKKVKCETCGEDVKIIENTRESLKKHIVSPKKYECLIIGIKNGDIVLNFENNKYKTALCDKCKKPIKLGKGFETFLEARKELLTFTEGHKKEEKVVHPSHYQLGELGIEAMDVMRAVMTKEQLKGFHIGNAIKYTLRAEKKNGLEDYKKARYYLDELIKEEEDESIN